MSRTHFDPLLGLRPTRLAKLIPLREGTFPQFSLPTVSRSGGITLRRPEITTFDLLSICLVLIYPPVAQIAPRLFSRPQQLGDSSRVADDAASLHTPTMTIKNAALLALVGTILATVLLVWMFASTVVNVLRGVAPAVMLFPWFVYAFACFSVAVFFYVFHRAQS